MTEAERVPSSVSRATSPNAAPGSVHPSTSDTIIIVVVVVVKEKRSMLAGTHIFQPQAFESHGPQNASAISFIKELGHGISQRDPVPLSTAQCDVAEI